MFAHGHFFFLFGGKRYVLEQMGDPTAIQLLHAVFVFVIVSLCLLMIISFSHLAAKEML